MSVFYLGFLRQLTLFVSLHSMCLWGGFLAILRYFIPSFLRITSKLDEQSSEFRRNSKKGCNETVKVSEHFRSARRILFDEDSAYDTLVSSSFSPSLSMERGYKSDNSDSKINTDTECPRVSSYFSPNKSENTGKQT